MAAKREPTRSITPIATPVQTRQIVNNLYIDGWPIRRRVMFMALLYCAGNVQYLLIWGADTGLNKEIATTLLWTAAATIGAYVFGAVWDDNNRRANMPTPEQRWLPETAELTDARATSVAGEGME